MSTEFNTSEKFSAPAAPAAPAAQIIGPGGKVLNQTPDVTTEHLAAYRKDLLTCLTNGVISAYLVLPNDVTGYERMAGVIGFLKAGEGVGVSDDPTVGVARQRAVLALLEYFATIDAAVPRYATLQVPGIWQRPVTPESARDVYKQMEQSRSGQMETQSMTTPGPDPTQAPPVSAVNALTAGAGALHIPHQQV